MSAAENLYDTTQNFLTPDSVRKFSMALDEPSDKVHAGLSSVVPTLLNRFINEGSTSEGAKRLVHLIESQNLDGTLPSNLNDRSYLSQGEHVVEDIFGKNYHKIASSLTPTTGMNPQNVEKMMEMAAPAVLGTIANKVESNLSAESLKRFFIEQKSRFSRFQDKKKPSFYLVVLAFFGIIAAAFWLISRENLPVARLERDISSIERSVSNTPVVASKAGLGIQDLETFLSTATMNDVPKRFTVRTLAFVPGTTDMGPGGDLELNQIVGALKRYPKASASIEAYIEDTGDSEENLLLSENRAMLIREELIGRGVEPSRVRAEGRGIKVDQNQLYFVITNLK